MMHAIIYGCSGAIAMNLTVSKKQVEKQWRQKRVTESLIIGINVQEIQKSYL